MSKQARGRSSERARWVCLTEGRDRRPLGKFRRRKRIQRSRGTNNETAAEAGKKSSQDMCLVWGQHIYLVWYIFLMFYVMQYGAPTPTQSFHCVSPPHTSVNIAPKYTPPPKEFVFIDAYWISWHNHWIATVPNLGWCSQKQDQGMAQRMANIRLVTCIKSKSREDPGFLGPKVITFEKLFFKEKIPENTKLDTGTRKVLR